MTVPFFYSDGTKESTLLRFVELLLFLKFGVYIFINIFFDTFAWTNDAITSLDLIYYSVLPSNYRTDFWIGINNFTYFVYLIGSMTSIIFICVTLIWIGSVKKKFSFIWLVGPSVVALAEGFRVLYLTWGTIQCVTFTQCKIHNTNRDFYIYYYLSIADFALSLFIIAMTIIISILMRSIVKEEGVKYKRYGPVCFECLPFTEYLAPFDLEPYLNILIQLLAIFHFISYFIGHWYLTRFIWTTHNRPTSMIPYYNALPPDARADWIVGHLNVIYFVYFIQNKIMMPIGSILLFLVVAGSKFKSSYGIQKLFFFILSLTTFGFVLVHWVIVFLDCKNYAICTSTKPPYGDPYNVYFYVIGINVVLYYFLYGFSTVICYILEQDMNRIVDREKDNGVFRSNARYNIPESYSKVETNDESDDYEYEKENIKKNKKQKINKK